MKEVKRAHLNLATHPVRNRRLFYLFFGALVGSFLIVSTIAGSLFWKYRTGAETLASSTAEMQKSVAVSQKDQEKFEAAVKEISGTFEEKVDHVNSIILKKTFSWAGFLSTLETALPDSAFILSLAPTMAQESKVNLKIKVVSRDLNDLLALITNLHSLGFAQIRVESEARNERGQLVSEISLSYERTI